VLPVLAQHGQVVQRVRAQQAQRVHHRRVHICACGSTRASCRMPRYLHHLPCLVICIICHASLSASSVMQQGKHRGGENDRQDQAGRGRGAQIRNRRKAL
jgi:hypothetical protein